MTQDRTTDPERSRAETPFDQKQGFSGQDYHVDDERRLAEDMPAGSVAPEPSRVEEDDDLPPDAGRRASFDPRTGEVHGSGVGSGGGSPGEDFDGDSANGDGPGYTGAGVPKP